MAEEPGKDQKLNDMQQRLTESQNVEQDNREKVREADLFLNKRDGQWEPEVIRKMSGKPRYTFDQCNPVVDDVMGEMETTDFAVSVKPSGGEASKETAEQYQGIVRQIENISKARHTYNAAARTMTGQGLSGWRIVQRFKDSDSFSQDLMIDPLSNFVDRVWYDAGATLRTMADADDTWVLSELTLADYNRDFPEGSGQSVSQNRQSQSWSHIKKTAVVIGEWYHRVKTTRELALLSNNQIVVIDDDFDKVRDEMAAKGVTVERTRKRDLFTIHHRVFDGADWLGESKKTVFESTPVIPVYANFEISEGKVIYWGAVEKLIDPQRVLNYAESRKIEDGALKPRSKVWMTRDQAKSPEVRNTLRTANTNTDSHQLYDKSDGSIPPFRPQDPQPDTTLIETAQSAERFIQRSGNLPDVNRGVGLASQSGIALQTLSDRGNNANFKYFTAMEIAIGRTCEVLVKAVPITYDTKQEMVLLGQDGTINTITLKDVIIDEESNTQVEINDLSKGQYSVTCSAGPAFHNRQQETVTAINEIAKINPDVMLLGGDIMLNNMASAGTGIGKIAERMRAKMVAQGLIPEDQLTDEEKEKLQAQSEQQNQPTAVDQALIAEASARTEEVQAKTADTLSKIEERQIKAQIEAGKMDQRQQESMMKFETDKAKLAQTRNQQIVDVFMQQNEQIKTMAETLKVLREAMGVDQIVGPHNTEAYINQAKDITDAQEAINVPGDPGALAT